MIQYGKNVEDEFLSGYFEFKADDLCLKETDFQTNMKKYKKEYIESGDKVMKLLIFDGIPVQYRKFTLSLRVKSDIIQKSVDFRFIRFEYRHSGRYFVKPDKNID